MPSLLLLKAIEWKPSAWWELWEQELCDHYREQQSSFSGHSFSLLVLAPQWLVKIVYVSHPLEITKKMWKGGRIFGEIQPYVLVVIQKNKGNNRNHFSSDFPGPTYFLAHFPHHHIPRHFHLFRIKIETLQLSNAACSWCGTWHQHARVSLECVLEMWASVQGICTPLPRTECFGDMSSSFTFI